MRTTCGVVSILSRLFSPPLTTDVTIIGGSTAAHGVLQASRRTSRRQRRRKISPLHTEFTSHCASLVAERGMFHCSAWRLRRRRRFVLFVLCIAYRRRWSRGFSVLLFVPAPAELPDRMLHRSSYQISQRSSNIPAFR